LPSKLIASTGAGGGGGGLGTTAVALAVLPSEKLAVRRREVPTGKRELL
jgi:hypothetical protein